MADAIKFQLNMTNGALNLAYNEIVKTWYNTGIQISSINDLDWSVLIITGAEFLTSFVIFRDAWDGSNISRETSGSMPTAIIVYGISVNSSDMYAKELFKYNYQYGTSSGIRVLGLVTNGALLILAK